MKISIAWRDLELENGAYNESYAAGLRKQLVEAESRGETAVMELQLTEETAPERFRAGMGNFFADEELQARYIEAAAHCRRRLKNCGALERWVLACPRPVPEAFIRRLGERLAGTLTLQAPGPG
ncbi:MAG: hypothetical protein LBK77_00650 [Spirochaetaceae bacterium]|nr:hypothetical protein [Spirochaetaceae bacterium]